MTATQFSFLLGNGRVKTMLVALGELVKSVEDRQKNFDPKHEEKQADGGSSASMSVAATEFEWVGTAFDEDERTQVVAEQVISAIECHRKQIAVNTKHQQLANEARDIRQLIAVLFTTIVRLRRQQQRLRPLLQCHAVPDEKMQATAFCQRRQ